MNKYIYFILYCLYLAVFHKFFTLLIGQRKICRKLLLSLYLGISLLATFLTFSDVSMGLKLIIIFLTYYIISLAYGNIKRKRLLGVFLTIGLSSIVENVLFELAFAFTLNISVNGLFLINILIFYLLYQLTKAIMSFNESPIPLSHTVIIMVIPLVSILLVFSKVRNIYGFVFLLVIFYLCLFLYSLFSDYFADRLYSQAIKNQNEALKDQIHLINLTNRKTRALRHDLKRELNLIAHMLDNNDELRARKFLENYRLQADMCLLTTTTGNNYIDSLLEVKVQEAKKLGATIHTSLNLIGPIDESLNDLYLLLSNLLDNALEALKKTEDKNLWIVIEREKEYLNISLSNNYTPNASKNRKGNHGYGLLIVRNIVDKYDGKFSIYKDQKIFNIKITLALEGDSGRN